MQNKRKLWLYVSLSGFVLMLLFMAVFVFNKGINNLSVSGYFFLLIICSLAATAFLSGALKSTATWEGSFMKGTLKLAGPPVIFFVLLIVGYNFRPIPKASPFDLTIFVSDPAGLYKPANNDMLIVENGNNKQQALVGDDESAHFHNINSEYRGNSIRLISKIDNYAVAASGDTIMQIPNEDNPVIHLPLRMKYDSTLYTGIVVVGKDSPVKHTIVNFTSYSKKAITDDEGVFQIYLTGRIGDKADVLIVDNGKIRYDNKVVLSTNIKIPLP